MKILIVRFSSIGDIILTTPVVRWVSNQLKAEVHFLCFDKYKSIIASNPHLSKIHTIKESINEALPQLKSEKFDLIIDLHKNIRTRSLKLKLGVKSISFNKANIDKWMMVNLKRKLDSKLHLVERYLLGLDQLGLKDDGLGLDYFFKENELNTQKPLFKYDVLVLGATYFTKRIPLNICEDIIKANEKNIILIGGKDVIEEAKTLAEEYPKKTINYVGKISLDKSAFYLKHAAHVHTSDTGMMHIAAAFQVPITVYWGNTIPAFGMYPYYGHRSKYYTELDLDL